MAKQKKLMLVKDVATLGSLGDVVKVRQGYARNFLIPQGFAAPVSQDAIRRVHAERKKAAMVVQKAVDQAKATQDMLRSISLHIEANAAEGGHLFGSVTTAMIAEALTAQGVKVEASAVMLDNPIKELGIYQVSLRLHAEVMALVKVYVVSPPPEKAEAKK